MSVPVPPSIVPSEVTPNPLRKKESVGRLAEAILTDKKSGPAPDDSDSDSDSDALTRESTEAEFARLRLHYKMPSKILPYMYVGTRAAALDRDVLRECGITHILNVKDSCSYAERHPNGPDDAAGDESGGDESTDSDVEEMKAKSKAKPQIKSKSTTAATASAANANAFRIKHLHVPVSDFGNTQLASEGVFERCNSFIAEAKLQFTQFALQQSSASAAAASGDGLRLSRPGIVLVHCSMGVNRSPSIALGWLMYGERYTLARAYEYVKSKRSRIAPHEEYMKQLREYEIATLKVAVTSMPIEASPVTLQQQLRQLRTEWIAEAQLQTGFKPTDNTETAAAPANITTSAGSIAAAATATATASATAASVITSSK